jgi:alpha-galactosidase
MKATRRTFLQAGCASAALAPWVNAEQSQSVRISSQKLALHFQLARGSSARLPVCRNEVTGFNWAGHDAAVSPILSARSAPKSEAVLESWKSTGSSELELGFKFDCGIVVQNIFRAIPGMPVIECATQCRNAGSKVVEQIDAIGLRIPLRSGFGPLDVYAARRDSYGIERLPFTTHLELDGGGWNNPGYAGLIALRANESQELLLLGIEWERGWRYSLQASDDVIWMQFASMDLQHTISPGELMRLPRLFLCAVNGEADDAFRSAQRYLKSNVAPKTLANWPWVVYDIWGTEPKGVEQALLDEIDPAANLGVELFYVDAAWYAGSSKKGNGDWGCGLGNYTDDREKFPRGLAHISQQVHARGMKFGLWVGPNIVDSRLVPDRIPQRWIAQKDGENRVLRIKSWESPALQVCLGCPEYVEFLKQNLSRIVREFNLDWLKWDNSGIPGRPGECHRSDHGHQAGDGSYAALLGQYEVFEYLHREFPDLVLEQCGFGSRLDLGLANSIRANWLSDASFPSSHVRQNALIASYIYPTSYNGAWVLRDKELESTKSPALLDSIYRSRMMGLFGFGTLHGTLPERVSLFPAEALAAARRNVPLYKRYRHLLQGDAYHLFPPTGSPEGWQAIQFISANGREAVVLCFRNGSKQAMMRLPVRALDAAANYRLESANGTELGSSKGARLLREGLVIQLSEPEMSDVILINV